MDFCSETWHDARNQYDGRTARIPANIRIRQTALARKATCTGHASRKDGDGTNEQLAQARDGASGTRATTLVPLQGKMGKYQPMLKRTPPTIDSAFFANGLS